MLKTAASGLGFQYLPRDLVKVNAWKTMFDPYIIWCKYNCKFHLPVELYQRLGDSLFHLAQGQATDLYHDMLKL